MKSASLAPLPREFYRRPTLAVARDLLGMHLYHALPDGTLRSGRIVEVESYGGPEDRASHARLRKASGGAPPKPTARSEVMFGPPGVAYVYLIYGMHHCFNAVAHVGDGDSDGSGDRLAGAVLIRAMEPGPDLSGSNCRGPARLCVALGIDLRHNRLDLCLPGPSSDPVNPSGDRLIIADRGTPVRDADVVRTPRIGVDYAGDDAGLPWRLCDRTSVQLSRKV
jgi:DNA-3-methyladenine glycosylase